MMLLRPERETRQQPELPVRPVETEACCHETDREDGRCGNQADAVEENPVKATKNYCALLEDPPKGG